MTTATLNQIDAVNVATDAFMAASKIAFAGVERLAALNLSVARAALDEGFASTSSMFKAKDFTELRSLQMALAKPAGERSAAYIRDLKDIAEETQGEMTKLVTNYASDRGVGSRVGEGWAKGFEIYKQAATQLTAMTVASTKNLGDAAARMATAAAPGERHTA